MVKCALIGECDGVDLRPVMLGAGGKDVGGDGAVGGVWREGR